MISLNINTETNISLNNYIINSINIFKYTPGELHKYVMDKCNDNPLIYIKDDHPVPDQTSGGENILDDIITHFNCILSDGDKKIMDVIIASLSPKGFLESTPAEIASIANGTSSRAEALIEKLMSYDSKGIGSYDTMDFIKFQLKINHTYNEELFYAFKNHLEEISASNFGFLSELDITQGTLIDYMENCIKECRLSPLDGDESIDILPEGSIKLIEDRLQIHIDDYLAENLVYEPIYLSEGDTNFSEKMKAYQDEYSELVSMLNARKIYMLKILNVICEVQRGYLTGEYDYLNSLDQTTLAELTKLSPATISRLISSKYISTPQGVLPMQSLLSKECYKGFSVSQVKFVIRSIDRYDTLSDNEISLILSELGIKISRRTVNKYKNQIAQ
ncbi:hypothetical protein [Salinicoccus sp. YB14-2]|uniref:RNA polymerase factor sigma-54 n=1 Tax=Salinicoccus sp. YB14-2 TaxID=1572701 RepID=UPI00068988DC|nr:hypothetical protein [Salinicoccus sp. YB14-2]